MPGNTTRITTDLFPKGVFHPNVTDPMVDVRRGGQFGFTVDMAAIMNDTPHVSNNVICRVLSSPRAFNDLPNAAVWHGAFKALFETHALQISGLNQTLTPSWSGTPFGGSGEEFEVPVGMTREKSDVTFSFVEKYGLPITRMVELYHRLLIQDENTKHPGIAMIKGDLEDGLADYYTWTMIFFEPDRYLQHVRRSWMIANMGIKNSPDNQSKKDKTSDQELLNFDLQMTGVSQVTHDVDNVAQAMLNEIRASQTDPMRAPAFMQSPGADISDRTDTGYQERMEEMSREQIGPDV